jgi:hypothetical protein
MEVPLERHCAPCLRVLASMLEANGFVSSHRVHIPLVGIPPTRSEMSGSSPL